MIDSPEGAAIYRRVSTDHQDNSLQVQETLNDEYCKRLNLYSAIPTAAAGTSDRFFSWPLRTHDKSSCLSSWVRAHSFREKNLGSQ